MSYSRNWQTYWEGDDAKAIEASLAENVARLPMDEIDQYKAFAALIKEGSTPDDIAAQFGVTERLVNQRLAIANLQPGHSAKRRAVAGADAGVNFVAAGASCCAVQGDETLYV